MTPKSLPGATGSAPKSPLSVGQLHRLVLAYARQQGQTEKRTRDWISYMAVGGVLERTGGTGVDAHFTLKGGVALEMRRQGMARATRDLDLSYRGPETDDLVGVLEEALSNPYGRFTFQRTGKPLGLSRVNTMRMDIKVRFNGSEWGTVIIDVNQGEGVQTEVELVDAFDIEQAFGIEGPDKLPCLSLRHHMAQKLHGMTLPPLDKDTQNERVQDAIDVLLFREEFADEAWRARLREACEEIFTARGTHEWPPVFNPPEHWREAFSTMAKELGIPAAELDAATREIREFIQAVSNAKTPPESEDGAPQEEQATE